MKIALFMLFAVAASCHGQVSWRIFFPEDAPALTTSPILKDVTVDKERVTARLYNAGDKPIYYRGSSADRPVFFYDEQVNGTWKEGKFSSCGTGLSEHTLGAGKAIVIAFPPPDSQQFRLFTAVSESREGRESMVLVVSNE